MRSRGRGSRSRIAWTSGETRTCLAIHDAADGTLTELNEAGPTVSPAEWAGLEQAVRAELATGGAGLLTISGSLPPGPRTTGSPGSPASRSRPACPWRSTVPDRH